MLSHLRISAPPELADRLACLLADDDRVAGVARFAGASLVPAGDVVEADVAREATSEIVEAMAAAGLTADSAGELFISESGRTPSGLAERAERAAPGNPDDSVVWDSVRDDALDAVAPSMSFVWLMVLAVALAAVAIVTDSAVLVVGAMVVGPDFASVAAICIGLVLGQPRVAWGAARQLATAIAVAVTAVALTFASFHLLGWLPSELVTGPRPQTSFIWHPSWWSFLVALIAGAAGVLAMTVGKSNTMVGVFISVTTVPAIGDFALGVAIGDPAHMAGAAAQLGVNLAGMVLAGTLTVGLQRLAWNRVVQRRQGRR